MYSAFLSTLRDRSLRPSLLQSKLSVFQFARLPFAVNCQWRPVRCNSQTSEAQKARVANATNFGSLAGRLAYDIRIGKLFPVEASGPNSVLTAVKAIMYATMFTEKTHGKQSLAFTAESVQREVQGGDTFHFVRFNLRRVLTPKLKRGEDLDMYVTSRANPRRSTSVMKGLLEKNGDVTMATMGAKSMNLAVKMVLYTSSQVPGELIVTPMYQKFSLRGQELKRLVLHCRHIPDMG